jgi:hypothetical protein
MSAKDDVGPTPLANRQCIPCKESDFVLAAKIDNLPLR